MPLAEIQQTNETRLLRRKLR